MMHSLLVKSKFPREPAAEDLCTEVPPTLQLLTRIRRPTGQFPCNPPARSLQSECPVAGPFGVWATPSVPQRDLPCAVTEHIWLALSRSIPNLSPPAVTRLLARVDSNPSPGFDEAA